MSCSPRKAAIPARRRKPIWASLAAKDNIIALEFHVDYWNDLVHGGDGRWRDVHSSAAYTERQRAYAARLPRGQVCTPQMVIDGQSFAVGSRRQNVSERMRQAQNGAHRRLAVAVSHGKAARYNISVAGRHNGPATVWLVRFTKAVTTRIRAGENRGKTLTNHNIVTEVKRIAQWRGQALSVAVKDFTLKPGEGCAILVQDNAAGPILGAAHCPAGAGG
ncbi:MAG: DUF1223 domain-containing protein [Rhodospirillales bacterium]